MNVGILLAGGTGTRMGAGVPKQFLEIDGKPVITFPLEIMENNPDIDSVEIVCVHDYVEQLRELCEENRFTKVRWIVPGGGTCQESTYNGLRGIREYVSSDDIVLIHMSSYPLASRTIMSSCIESAVRNGNGCTARPVVYSVFSTEDRKTSVSQVDRDSLMLCSNPYAFRYGECIDLYERAFREGKGIKGNVYTNTLYCDYGNRIYFVPDSEMNIKITTPGDMIFMRSVLNALGADGRRELGLGREGEIS